ncbi:MAG: DNA polymerase Y family protein [Gammaproteobacteria bacterium]|nr:DNA polymerase Y family protein [Gammaproteobacteria bacterium]
MNKPGEGVSPVLTPLQPLQRLIHSVPRTPPRAVPVGALPAATPSPVLWLAIHLPQLALDIITRAHAERRACVLVDGDGVRQRIACVNREAARLGIRPGMAPGAAHALGEVQVLARTPAAEDAALARLCAWAWQFTPVVSVDAPDTLLLEVRGSLALFGGLHGLLSRLRRGLRELGMQGFAFAAAPTPRGATWLARGRQTAAIDSLAALPAALAMLPLDVLCLPVKQLQDLHGIGVHTLGDCWRLPREGLTRRFAPALLQEFDRALGREPDPRSAFTPPACFAERLDLLWEIRQVQMLATGMERLLHELGGNLRAQGTVLRGFTWTLHHRDGERTSHRIALVAPSRDVAHFARLTREYFARRRLTSPVRAIELEAGDFEVQQVPVMEDLFRRGPAAQESEERWPQFLERLQARLGAAALKQIVARSDHRPERAMQTVPIGTPLSGSVTTDSPVHRRRSRPLWLTREPLPLPERNGRPALGGVLTLSPERERVQGGWWEGVDLARDYFVARDSHGTRWWVFRELGGSRGWYLHGLFE